MGFRYQAIGIEPAPPEPFVFRSLDLRQQNGKGEPAWDLTSPEARYDLIRQLAQASRPRGTIYRRGKPHITVSATRGTVIGDGQAIQLEGDVLITLLGRNPVRISGDQARWIPRDDLMVIDRRPLATDRRSRISAQTARYLLAEDRVELRGFGAFSAKARNARMGRNPRTGESVEVVAKRVPFFKTGKELRERLNLPKA